MIRCNICGKQIPDSFHDFDKICTCKTKQQWIKRAKKNKWDIRIGGKLYKFAREKK